MCDLHVAWKSTTTSLEPAALSSASNSTADETSLTIVIEPVQCPDPRCCSAQAGQKQSRCCDGKKGG